MGLFDFNYNKAKPYNFYSESTLEDDKINFEVHGKKRTFVNKVFSLKGFTPVVFNGKEHHVPKKSYDNFIEKFPVTKSVEEIKEFQEKVQTLITNIKDQPTKSELHELYLFKGGLDNRIDMLKSKAPLYEKHLESNKAIKAVFESQDLLNRLLSDQEAIWKPSLTWVKYKEQDTPLCDLFYKKNPPPQPKVKDDRVWSLDRNLNRGVHKELFEHAKTWFEPSWINPKAYSESLADLTDSVSDQEVTEFLIKWQNDPKEFLENFILNVDDRTPIIALKAMMVDPDFHDSAITICNAWSLARDFGSHILRVKVTSLEEGKEALIKNIQHHYFLSFVQIRDVYKMQVSDDKLTEFALAKATEHYDELSLNSKNMMLTHVDFVMSIDDLPDLYGVLRERVKFNLFTPFETGSRVHCILPCFGTIKQYFKAVHKENAIHSAPALGLSTVKEIWDDILKGQHQTGVNVPGVEVMVSADGYKCGLLGFFLHDLFHINVGGYVPVAYRNVYSRLLLLSQEYLAQNPDTLLLPEVYRYIDMDHVEFKEQLFKFYIRNFKEPNSDELDLINGKAFIETISDLHSIMNDKASKALWNIVWNDRINWKELGLTTRQRRYIESAGTRYFQKEAE